MCECCSFATLPLREYTEIMQADTNTRASTAAMRVGLLGGGSFGTVLAHLLAENNCQVRWWMHNKTRAETINYAHCNPDYLSHVRIPEQVIAGTDIAWALEHPGLIILAIPSQVIGEVLAAVQPHLKPEHYLIATAKGIPGPGFTLLHQRIEQTLYQLDRPQHEYALLSGPNIASEIAAQKIAASVIATHDRNVYNLCQQRLQRPYFRLFHNPDVFGVEIGGALKNIYAIAAGLADAYGMGWNTKSALIVRAASEITAFAVQLGANPLTFLGMAGVGDLVVTCSSSQSRNYQAGYQLGKGIAPQQLQKHVKGVIEGIHTLKLVHVKAQELGVRMPIMQGMHAILFSRKNYLRTMRELMETMQGADISFITVG